MAFSGFPLEDKIQTLYLSARPSAARAQPTRATLLPAPLPTAVLGQDREPWLCSSERAALSFPRTLVCTLEQPPCSNLCPSLTPWDCRCLPLPCFHATVAQPSSHSELTGRCVFSTPGPWCSPGPGSAGAGAQGVYEWGERITVSVVWCSICGTAGQLDGFLFLSRASTSLCVKRSFVFMKKA